MIPRKLSLLCLMMAGSCLAFARDSRPPNVVIIYGDDVGFGDIGANGSTAIPTPHIDRLVANGLNFTDGHCTSSTCTPSRFSLLTGLHAFRYGARVLPPDAPLIIDAEKFTLADVFKHAGYATGYVGKWHLGLGLRDAPTDWNSEVKPGPLELGFDYAFLLPSTNDRVPTVYLRNHRVANLNPNDPLYVGRTLDEVNRPGSTAYPDATTHPEAMTYYRSTHGHNESVINGVGRIGYMAGGASALWNDETMTEVFVAESQAYIRAQAARQQPFLLIYAAQDIHVPRMPHPRFRGMSQLGFRGDAMVQFDWAVGQILATLEEYGLTKDTLVIFSSDNGPVYDDGYADGTTVNRSSQETDRGHDGSGVYRGGKYQVFEGGTRVPFIVSWPDTITPGESAATVSQVDLLASLAALLEVTVPADQAIDSRDTLATFLGQQRSGVKFLLQESFNGLALREGSWKFIESYRVPGWMTGEADGLAGLFNLEVDPGERQNLIAEYPERIEAMSQLLGEIKAGRAMRTLE